MKKLLFLLAAGVALNATAQENQSILLNAGKSGKGMIQPRKMAHPAPGTPTANKTTDALSGEWFCFPDRKGPIGTAVFATWPVYPDSNLYSYTGNFSWYLHGFGTSLDPKSTAFTPGGLQNSQPMYTVFPFSATDAYDVDSINIVGWYDRIDDDGVDTLNIYITYADDNDIDDDGARNVTWHYSGPVQDYWGRTDSSLQVAEPKYDWQTNSLNPDSVINVKKITKLLDAAAFADSMVHPTSDGSYLHVWSFEVPGGLHVPAGGNVIVFATFGSSHNYPIGTDLNVANKWNQWTCAVNGDAAAAHPIQEVGDYNTGIAAFTEDRYHLYDADGAAYWFLNDSSAVLAPTYAYTPIYMSDPWFAVHIKQPLGVKEVQNTVSDLNAYPNPANTSVNVAFTAANPGKATVSITNAIGQVVDSKVVNVYGGKTSVNFPTATLANGVYFYTVEANGQRQTNRLVVAH